MAWRGTKTFDTSSTYSFDDINRVNEAIQYLRDTLESYGYNIVLPKVVKMDYSRTDFPKVSDVNNIRDNIIQTIAQSYPVLAPVLTVNQSREQVFGYTEANAIEQNIQAIYDMIAAVTGYFKYAGQLSCGENQTYL